MSRNRLSRGMTARGSHSLPSVIKTLGGHNQPRENGAKRREARSNTANQGGSRHLGKSVWSLPQRTVCRRWGDRGEGKSRDVPLQSTSFRYPWNFGWEGSALLVHFVVPV